ncbi:RNA binding protein, heterogenous nuclear RNP-K like protein [Coemansia sp. RSA 552]|nr:RNA binding protein, heterogenous nuclear RNP-K like protein [Coemansia sp. RSA 552]
MTQGGDDSDQVAIPTQAALDTPAPECLPGGEPAVGPAEEVPEAPGGGRPKRPRTPPKGGNGVAAVDNDIEDINLHAEPGWSEDEKDEKEPPAKRLAAETGAGGPSTEKKAAIAALLKDFTVRAVVTRKDVDVVFGHLEGAVKDLESETGAAVTVVAGKDDPEIVVDRVLSVKGPIDGVAHAYSHIVGGMLRARATPSSAEEKGAAEEKDAAEEKGAAKETEEEAEGSPKPGPEPDQEPEPGVAAGTDQPASAPEKKPETITLRLLVPHKCVGSIMGHGGRTINNIREVSSVSIHTSESTLPRSDERIVEVIGAPASIQSAIKLIAEALTKDSASYNSAVHYVPAANLPSAMTVETQTRKRRDGRRQGNTARGPGSRNNGSAASGGYGQGRGNASASGNNNGGNRNGGGGGGNRYDRHSRHGNRQPNRNPRTGNAFSNVNRMPVGNGASGHSNSHGGGYRGGNQPGSMRPAGPAAMGYTGYAMPAAAAAYPVYGAQGMPGNGSSSGGPPAAHYGSGMSPVATAPPMGAYGGSYGAAAMPYQFASTGGYAYTSVSPHNMHGSRPMGSTAGYSSRSFPGYGSRPHMSQPGMDMGAARAPMGGNPPGDSVGQTIQQIYVPGDKIGAVIGRRGETINDIRRSTSARVDIQDSAQGAKERVVVITGAYEQVRSAYDMIKDCVDKARPTVPRP